MEDTFLNVSIIGVLSANINASMRVGGIIGQLQSELTSCYNTGKIYIKGCADEENSSEITIIVGGICGVCVNNISYCYNVAEIKIEGTITFRVGGITGTFNQGTIYNCYNSGILECNSESYIGGIIGYYRDEAKLGKTMQNNYFVNTENGIGYIATDNSTYTTKLEQELSKEELLNILNAEDNKFKVTENDNYPVLSWEN